jgi:hypothetical protein
MSIIYHDICIQVWLLGGMLGQPSTQLWTQFPGNEASSPVSMPDTLPMITNCKTQELCFIGILLYLAYQHSQFKMVLHGLEGTLSL